MSVCFRRAQGAGWRRTGLHEDLHVDGVAESCTESSSLVRARFGSRMCECCLRDCRLAGASAACARPFSWCANITNHVRRGGPSRNRRGCMLLSSSMKVCFSDAVAVCLDHCRLGFFERYQPMKLEQVSTRGLSKRSSAVSKYSKSA
jgi:hypothetical protein